jgi:site-specific recombinase XerD
MPGSGTPVIQITRHRETSTISSAYAVFSEEWNSDKNEVMVPENASPKRKKELSALMQKLKKDVHILRQAAKMLKAQGDYSAKELASYLRKRKQGQMFCEYANRKIEELSVANNHGTVHLYKYAIRSFLVFLENKDIRIDHIHIDLMKSYEQYLIKNKKSKNTVSCYMRSLRAIYKRAISEKVFVPGYSNGNPFVDTFTGNDKTPKRAIDINSIARLAELELKSNPKEKLCRDMFMFSFYTQGMPFVDLVNLKKDNIVGKYIRYKRQKTGQMITIELESCMERIIERYADKNSQYIFPVLRKIEKVDDVYPVWKRICHALNLYNKQLNKLAALAGIEERLTSYVARHSWATIASREGIPTTVISRGMGHESERTTQFYIAQVDYSDVGQANRKILAQLASNTVRRIEKGVAHSSPA